MIQCYLVICVNQLTDEICEVSTVHTSRKEAEQCAENLNLNFIDLKHIVKPMNLNGAVQSMYNEDFAVFKKD